MEQKENFRIGVDYKLYTFLTPGKDEELSEETRAGEPFRFLSGFGMVLEDFEQAIMPLAIGDTFDFTVPVERAYGEYDQRGIIELDKEMFTIDGKFDSEHVAEGNIIQLQNAEGRQFPGLVISIGEKVRIDLNHPLAGKNLHFTGKVTEKVLASPQETPLRISTLSASLRLVVMALCPGRRLLSSDWMKPVSISIPAGMPSTTPPTASPWLSPKVVRVNNVPVVFIV